MTRRSDSGRTPGEMPQSAGSTMPVLIPQPHGGALLSGGVPGNRGGGRLKDEIRQRLQRVTDEQGVAFLEDVLAGRVTVEFVGTCPNCHAETRGSDMSAAYLERLEAAARVTVAHRLQAVEQALRYGVGTQTETVTADTVR